jgi:uncharacterized protein (DUF4213/DUF364 family)
MQLYEKILNSIQFDDSVIIDYVIGLNYVAVTTEHGTGLAYVVRGSGDRSSVVLNSDMTSKSAAECAKLFLADCELDRAFGLAAINSILNNQNGSTVEKISTGMFADKIVGMVGFIEPYVPRVSRNCKKLHIFEIKDIDGTLSPEDASKYLPDCDIAIFTAVTLINRTIEDYLEYVKDDAQKIILGPSTPMSDYLAEDFMLAGSRVVCKPSSYDKVKKGFGTKYFKDSIIKIWR